MLIMRIIITKIIWYNVKKQNDNETNSYNTIRIRIIVTMK